MTPSHAQNFDAIPACRRLTSAYCVPPQDTHLCWNFLWRGDIDQKWKNGERRKQKASLLSFFFFIRTSLQILPWHVNANNACTGCRLILMTGSTSGVSQTWPKIVLSLNKDMCASQSCGEGEQQLCGLQHPAAPVLDLFTHSSPNPHPEQTSWERQLHTIRTPSHSSLTLFSLTNPNLPWTQNTGGVKNLIPGRVRSCLTWMYTYHKRDPSVITDITYWTYNLCKQVRKSEPCLQLLGSCAFNSFSFLFLHLRMNKTLRRYVYHGLLQ